MQIMAEKGLVTRDESDRTHVYTARLSQDQTQRQLVSDLVDRAFGGSAAALVLQAFSAHSTSPADLVQHPAVSALAWALFHFVWQGAAIAGAAFVAFRCVRPSPSWRYAVGVGA